MPLILPYPTSPQNGQTGDANVIFANQSAIAQAIQSFDGSQIQAGTIGAAAFNANINPNTVTRETESNFVYSGAIVSSPSGLNITITGGTIYVNGIRLVFIGVGSNLLTLNKDTYIDVDYNGNVYYLAVANGAAAPALTALSVRIAKVVTGATTVTSVTQYGVDSLGNSIYPQGSTGTNNIDWDRFFVNAKSATNAGSISPANTDNNLNANGVGVTFVTAAPCVALVTVSMGVSSTTDFEFQPEILLNGGLMQRMQPSAAAGNTSNRATVRSFSAVIPIPTPGTNVISAAVTFSAGTGLNIAPTAATISAVVFGKVTS